MADDVSFIFFRAGRGDLGTAAAALVDCGMRVQRITRELGDELTAGWPDGPQLRIAFVQEPYVREEAVELSEGEPHAAEISKCDVRYEILIDDLDAVLDEINTMIEVQGTLQDATGGYMYNTWNGVWGGPHEH